MNAESLLQELHHRNTKGPTCRHLSAHARDTHNIKILNPTTTGAPRPLRGTHTSKRFPYLRYPPTLSQMHLCATLTNRLPPEPSARFLAWGLATQAAKNHLYVCVRTRTVLQHVIIIVVGGVFSLGGRFAVSIHA